MEKELMAKLKSANIDFAEYERLSKIFVEPATVVAIVKAGYEIYKMFQKKPNPAKEQIEYLKAIYAEIRDMQNDLTMIINLLNDLKVYIDTTQIQFISNTLASRINTANLIMIGWLENKTGDLEAQFALIHETKDLLGLYGYAHLHIYLLAFEKELELCHWLKKGPAFKAALLEDSRKYLGDVLNENHRLETPAKRLAYSTKLLLDLQENFKEGTFTYETNTILQAGGCGTDGLLRRRHTLIISGNIAEGFSFNITDLDLEYRRPQSESCSAGGGNSGSGGHKAKTLADQLEENLTKSYSQSMDFNKMIKDYNDAKELYSLHSLSKLELTATLNIVGQVAELIDKKKL